MKTPLTIILFFLVGIGSGQTTNYSLTVKITDSTTKETLANATVLLESIKAGIKTTIRSDAKGYFTADKLAAGDYTISVWFVGFIPYKSVIQVKGDETILIWLQRATTGLSGVTVTADKKVISYTSNQLIYNVSESAVSASDNVYNLLLKLPGMTVSNGSFFYQGKPVSIAFDGKPNNLMGEDLNAWLSDIQGTHIDKLEVLLNPSARYDAQGGIVVNIRSKRNKNYGVTKSVTLGAGKGTYLRVPLGFSFNYRDSMINIYGGYDYNYTKQFFHLNALFGFDTDPSRIDLKDHNIRTQDNHSVRVGIDYEPNKKTAVGLLLRIAKNFRKRDINDLSVSYSGTTAIDTVVAVNILTDASYFIPSVNLYLRRSISKKGSEIVVNADYWGLVKKWGDDISGAYSEVSGKPISSYQLKNTSPARNSVSSLTADYSLPLKQGLFEAGLKVTESKTDNDVLWKRLINTEWKTDSMKTNHFVYTEHVYAAYSNMTRTYGKWTVQAGLRAELTRSTGNSITLGLVTKRSYDDLFPAVNVQYKPSKKHLLSFNYKKSIKRFGFDIINPFINLQGQYSYHKGNPYIRPSYYNSIGLNWSYKNNLVLSGSVSLVKDPISYAYEKGPDNTSYGTNLNFSSGRLFNISATYTVKLFKGKWTSINTFNFAHTELPDFNSYIQHTNNYAFNSVNTISLPRKITLEVSGLYNSPLLDGTVWQSNYYGMSLGISKPVLGSKGSLKLSCTDIFDSQILHFKTRGRGISITSDWKVESRFINFLFTYRFGNLNVKGNKNRKTGIEDEKARMSNN